jgi:hypothetical protein
VAAQLRRPLREASARRRASAFTLRSLRVGLDCLGGTGTTDGERASKTAMLITTAQGWPLPSRMVRISRGLRRRAATTPSSDSGMTSGEEAGDGTSYPQPGAATLPFNGISPVPSVRRHRATLPPLCTRGASKRRLTDWLCRRAFTRRNHVRGYAPRHPFFRHSHSQPAKAGKPVENLEGLYLSGTRSGARAIRLHDPSPESRP